jgi:hypothetical protein
MNAREAIAIGEHDQKHEAIIAAVTERLIATQDRRYAVIQERLIAMRTDRQIERMERERGLA